MTLNGDATGNQPAYFIGYRLTTLQLANWFSHPLRITHDKSKPNPTNMN